MKIHRDPATYVSLSALSLLALSGCVTQRAYHDLAEEKRVIALELQDLKTYMGELESINEGLAGELEGYRASGPIEAGATAEIDKRIQELKQVADGIAGSDITLLTVEGGYGLRLDDAVLFDTASATLKPEGAELLQRMVAEIRQGSYERIWVRGHTDSVPVKKAETRAKFPFGNLEISVARAVSVASKLVEFGIPKESLAVAGFGPNEPIAKNDTTENRRKNRRVEIFVLDRSK